MASSSISFKLRHPSTLRQKNNIENACPKLKLGQKLICVSSCELGKQKERLFNTKTTRSSKNTVTTSTDDYMGPNAVESFNGKKYVLVIVDDYSRYTWTHFFEVSMLHHQDGENLDKMKEKGDACAETVTTSNELELGYISNVHELLQWKFSCGSKSFRYPPPLNIHSTHQTPTQVPTVTAHENIIQAETNTENAQFDDDEFINIFSTPYTETRTYVFVMRTRRQLETDGEMCMFALTVSRTEPKNIKEAMSGFCMIEYNAGRTSSV
ncbi:hypothetical protein Tco_0746956 [Tanacetum coccineum]